MSQPFVVGLGFVLAAGLLQGTFMLPMTLTRRWPWEHGWAMFSLLGMLLFNWALAGFAVPHVIDAYHATPTSDLAILALFGLLWGGGAVLFGLGMAKLGMTVGYPIIMGLIMSLGAIFSLLLKNPAGVVSTPGLLLLAGMAVTIGGIVVCSQAAAAKDAQPRAKTVPSVSSGLGAGLVIAVLAGVFSCLPPVGMSHAESLKAAAEAQGASQAMAGNAAWALFFTAGFVLNFGYCLFLMIRHGTFRALANDFGRNFGLIALMAAMWIGSFYLYGMGAVRMGEKWGAIIGWPLFISLSIVVGNVVGLARGEWRGASPKARARLNLGLVVLLAAMAIFGLASALQTG
jgi:L-rhamnose-H+ transport protein